MLISPLSGVIPYTYIYMYITLYNWGINYGYQPVPIRGMILQVLFSSGVLPEIGKWQPK